MSPVKAQKQRLNDQPAPLRSAPATLERDPFVIVASCRSTGFARVGVDLLLAD